ncbi:hypothetical protein J437_LFUL018057 [Ladona fulva]|uniref:Uncharacterized protein n=1 Tax=Ladona fulva TaxID=123851 RepID=A0A8K0KQ94_LADFU|nr:hypothetical protein J437_LFUL018057 [Ladona fulva]
MFMVNETNNYGEVIVNSKDLSLKSRMKSWDKLSCNEFYAFVALYEKTFYSGILASGSSYSYHDFWKVHAEGSILILHCLHFEDNSKPSLSDPLWKKNMKSAQIIIKKSNSVIFFFKIKLVLVELL